MSGAPLSTPAASTLEDAERVIHALREDRTELMRQVIALEAELRHVTLERDKLRMEKAAVWGDVLGGAPR